MKALVVDDDRVLADVVAFAMRREGFQVVQAYDGPVALQCWADTRPDLIILDINLPGIDGFSVCQRIRRETNAPIILLSVRDTDEDIMHGLEMGADVYLTKPFSPRLLVARAQALLRRTKPTQPEACSPDHRSVPSPQPRKELLGGHLPENLTPLEKRLFESLRFQGGKAISSDELIEQVWGPHGGDQGMLRQLVRRLRTKIEPDPAHPRFLVTIPGTGYCLKESRPAIHEPGIT
jgi:DNA-binding response OmpR family regulator